MKWIGIILAFLVVVAGSFLGYTWHEFSSPGQGDDWIRVDIDRGSSLTRVAELLRDKGLIRGTVSFTLWARIHGHTEDLQAGEYLFNSSMSNREILDHIIHGRIMTVTVTIPEGYSMKEIASVLAQRTEIDSVSFLRWCTNDSFARSLGIHADMLEGYLFPDTYTFSPHADPDRIAALMVARFRAILSQIEYDEEFVGLTLHQIITLASIVEKEARVPTERPMVAAVYLNRLRRGMKLDADPTVIYALGGNIDRLTYDDLKVSSPYNTYQNPGLPPGPICSPGIGCIRAVIYPEKDFHALYFVARGDGSHVFSRTFSEHNRAVREYRRSRNR